ncbi:hypothetical protein F4779DRAFT_584479 [Xylariaceae sp. FL0662B]|nr:hypothetical protein F4779DRAFT_584479 [Xylariaceae sp. FL0662B]
MHYSFLNNRVLTLTYQHYILAGLPTNATISYIRLLPINPTVVTGRLLISPFTVYIVSSLCCVVSSYYIIVTELWWMCIPHGPNLVST